RSADGAAHAERAIALFRLAGCEREEALTLLKRSACLLLLGEREEAHRCLERARQLADGLDDRVLASYVLANLGNHLLAEGRFDEAEPMLADGRQIGEETGMPHFAAIAASNLAVVALQRGKAAAARDLLE